MLIRSFDDSATAFCPQCKASVKCRLLGGMLIFGGVDDHLDIVHDDCGTKWRLHVYEGRTEVLPNPPEGE